MEEVSVGLGTGPGFEQQEISPELHDPESQHKLRSETEDVTSNPLVAIRWRGLVLFVVMVSYGVFAYENTLAANLRPQLVFEFGELGKLPILTIAYSLGGTTMSLIWSVLGLLASIVEKLMIEEGESSMAASIPSY
ncbi:hypothetical protein LTR42_007112 [Elasticomyces elasticus]|nr:hypothetical protein LTR42_007112 [Elasticomyces elasticus]